MRVRQKTLLEHIQDHIGEPGLQGPFRGSHQERPRGTFRSQVNLIAPLACSGGPTEPGGAPPRDPDTLSAGREGVGCDEQPRAEGHREDVTEGGGCSTDGDDDEGPRGVRITTSH